MTLDLTMIWGDMTPKAQATNPVFPRISYQPRATLVPKHASHIVSNLSRCPDREFREDGLLADRMKRERRLLHRAPQ